MALNSASRIVVMGGTSGIGLAVARAAADVGAQVIVGSRSVESVEPALAQIPAAAGQAVDVTSPESLEAFFAGTGEFDHLAYTAGDALVPCAIRDYTPGQAQRFFDIRLFRALDTVRAALPALRLAGSITLTAGTAAYCGGTGALLGAAASGAVISAARSLASELAPVRVNVAVVSDDTRRTGRAVHLGGKQDAAGPGRRARRCREGLPPPDRPGPRDRHRVTRRRRKPAGVTAATGCTGDSTWRPRSPAALPRR